MTPHQTLAVCVRLFSIWCFYYFGTTITGYYYYAVNKGDTLSIVIPSLAMFIVIVICLLMWFFPVTIAKKILPAANGPATTTPMFENWFSVGCSLIGVLALAKAIPALVSHLVMNVVALRLYPDTFEISPDWRLTVAYNIFQLAFGLWLFFGAKGLKKLLIWARYS